MKKLNLLSIITVCFLNTGKAQTLTASNCNPIAGDSYYVKSLNYSLTQVPGQNQTWSYGNVGMPVSSGLPKNCINNPLLTTYPAANIRRGDNFSLNNYAFEYLNVSNTGIELVNSTDILGKLTSYTNSRQLITYPFKYSDTFVDAWTYTTNATTYTTIGSSTVIADGTGTVTTLAGTFNNVLRVKTTISASTYSNTTGGQVSYYDVVTYQWYYPGLHEPLLSTFSQSVNGVTSATNRIVEVYINAVAVGQNNLEKAQTKLKIYPNPAHLNLSIEAREYYDVLDLQITDLDGRIIKRLLFRDNEKIEIDINDMDSGFYLLRGTFNGHSSIFEKIIKE